MATEPLPLAAELAQRWCERYANNHGPARPDTITFAIFAQPTRELPLPAGIYALAQALALQELGTR